MTEKEKENSIAKNHHKMAARHHIRDESINKEKHVGKILEKIDLSHLSTEQHQKAVDLITKVSDVFCQDSDDIGDVQNCKMKIGLKGWVDNQIINKLFTSSSSNEKRWLAQVVLRLQSSKQQDHIR